MERWELDNGMNIFRARHPGEGSRYVRFERALYPTILIFKDGMEGSLNLTTLCGVCFK